MQIHRPSRLLQVLALLPLSACGEAPGPAPQSISEFLQMSGFDTAPTTRQRSSVTIFDPQDAPLGSQRKLLPQQEVFIAARNLVETAGSSDSPIYGAVLSDLEDSTSFTSLGTISVSGSSEWVDSSGLADQDQPSFEHYKPRRGWVKGNFTDIHREQLVELTHFDGAFPDPTRCEARFFADEELLPQGQNLFVAVPGTSVGLLGGGESADNHINFASGDTDGDGLDELVVAFRDGVTDPSSVGVRLLTYEVLPSGQFFLNPETIYIEQSDLPGLADPSAQLDGTEDRNWWIEIACGNLDEDPIDEVVLVYNDNREDLNFENIAPSQYEVFDYTFGAFESVAKGTVGGDGSGTSGDLEYSRATVHLMQIDNDAGLEVVFAGIDKEVDPNDEDEDLDARYGLHSYDWTGSNLELTGSLKTEHEVGGSEPALIQFAFLESLDLNGDGLEEVFFGNSFARPIPDSEEDAVGIAPISVEWQRVESSDGPLTLPNSIFDTNEFSADNLSFGRLRCSFATGDVDGDGRGELAFLWGGPGTSNDQPVRLFIFEATGESLPGIDEEIDLQQPSLASSILQDESDSLDAIPLPTVHFLDTQDDHYIVEHVSGFSENSWMEPVLVAAAVAPPANNFGTQSIDATRTLLGPPESLGVGSETTAGAVSIEEAEPSTGPFSIEVSAECVVYVAGGNSDDSEPLRDAIATAMRQVYTRGSFYDAVHQLRFSTAPMEHTLIFATTSYDKYRYKILQSPISALDPDPLGLEIEIWAPRELELFAMERSQYNQIAPDQQHLITTDIINVAPGSVGSYPTLSEWLALHAPEGGLPVGLIPPSEPVALGAEVTTGVSHVFDDLLGQESGIEFEASVDVAANTAQPIRGFTMGTNFLAPLRIRSIEGSLWTGQVGGIASQAEFDNQFYRWGMGVRLATLKGPGWQFPVFDYFLE